MYCDESAHYICSCYGYVSYHVRAPATCSVGMNVGTVQVRLYSICRWLKRVKKSDLRGLYFIYIFFFMFHVEKWSPVNVRNKLKNVL